MLRERFTHLESEQRHMERPVLAPAWNTHPCHALHQAPVGNPLLEVRPQNTENKETFPIISSRNTPYDEREVQKKPRWFQ